MDIVYQRSLWPLGLLQSYFAYQWQIDMFTLLVEGNDIATDQLPRLLELLKILEQDKWFTRAWILQESVSAGCEMVLLIQHDPSLHKSELLGTTAGEIEITIDELRCDMWFAHGTLSTNNESINPDPEAGLLTTIDKITNFIPIVMIPPAKGFLHPDYRQTCNAAEALTYLQPRLNTVIADRIAIMGNLCDYKLRFNMEDPESRGYSFSLCAYALAILNGDLSLSKSDNFRVGHAPGFSWGPQSTLRMDQLRHFQDDNEVVRFSPANMADAGILVKGWLWKADEVLPGVDIASDRADLDPIAVIWNVLKLLIRRGRHEIAGLI